MAAASGGEMAEPAEVTTWVHPISTGLFSRPNKGVVTTEPK